MWPLAWFSFNRGLYSGNFSLFPYHTFPVFLKRNTTHALTNFRRWLLFLSHTSLSLCPFHTAPQSPFLLFFLIFQSVLSLFYKHQIGYWSCSTKCRGSTRLSTVSLYCVCYKWYENKPWSTVGLRFSLWWGSITHLLLNQLSNNMCTHKQPFQEFFNST